MKVLKRIVSLTFLKVYYCWNDNLTRKYLKLEKNTPLGIKKCNIIPNTNERGFITFTTSI